MPERNLLVYAARISSELEWPPQLESKALTTEDTKVHEGVPMLRAMSRI